MNVPVVATISVVAVLVTTINLFCLVVIVCSKLMRKPAHLAISALVIAHLAQGLFVIPSYAVKRADFIHDIHHKGILCDVFRFSYLVTNYCICLSLLVITIDRVLASRFPFRYRHKVTYRRMMGVMGVVWIYVLLMCQIPFVPKDGHHKPGCKYKPQKEWVMTMLFGHTLLPFILILCSYIYIFKKTSIFSQQQEPVMSSNKSTKFDIASSRRRSSGMNQQRTFKTCFIIVICYVLCWGPSLFYYVLTNICKPCFPKDYKDSYTEEIVGFVMKVLTFLDGILAPIIYLANNASFKVSVELVKKRISGQSKHTYQVNNRHLLNSSALNLECSTYSPSPTNTRRNSSAISKYHRECVLKGQNLFSSKTSLSVTMVEPEQKQSGYLNLPVKAQMETLKPTDATSLLDSSSSE